MKKFLVLSLIALFVSTFNVSAQPQQKAPTISEYAGWQVMTIFPPQVPPAGFGGEGLIFMSPVNRKKSYDGKSYDYFFTGTVNTWIRLPDDQRRLEGKFNIFPVNPFIIDPPPSGWTAHFAQYPGEWCDMGSGIEILRYYEPVRVFIAVSVVNDVVKYHTTFDRTN